MSDEGKPFQEVLGAVLAGDLQREAERVERDRKERERRQAAYLAASGQQGMSASQLIDSMLADAEKSLPDALRIQGKEVPDATPPKPRSTSKIPPPPTRR